MEYVKEFNAELCSLYELQPPITKAKMTQITKAAIRTLKYYKHAVQSVEKFIQKCRPEYKVPGLYIIDSIIRHSRKQFGADKDLFAPRFSKNIVVTFHNLLDCPPDDVSKMIRVLNLWQKNGVYQSSIIQPLLDLASDPHNIATFETVQKKVQRVTGLVPSMPLRCDQKPPALTADALQLGTDFKAAASNDPSGDLSKVLNQLMQSINPTPVVPLSQQSMQLPLMQQLLLQQLPMTSTSNNNKLLANLFSSISQSSVSNTATNSSSNSLETILASQIQVLVQQLIGGNATTTSTNTNTSLGDATQTNVGKKSVSNHRRQENEQHNAKLNDSFDNTDFLLDNYGNSKEGNRTYDDSEGAMRDSASYYEEPQMTSLDKRIMYMVQESEEGPSDKIHEDETKRKESLDKSGVDSGAEEYGHGSNSCANEAEIHTNHSENYTNEYSRGDYSYNAMEESADNGKDKKASMSIGEEDGGMNYETNSNFVEDNYHGDYYERNAKATYDPYETENIDYAGRINQEDGEEINEHWNSSKDNEAHNDAFYTQVRDVTKNKKHKMHHHHKRNEGDEDSRKRRKRRMKWSEDEDSVSRSGKHDSRRSSMSEEDEEDDDDWRRKKGKKKSNRYRKRSESNDQDEDDDDDDVIFVDMQKKPDNSYCYSDRKLPLKKSKRSSEDRSRSSSVEFLRREKDNKSRSTEWPATLANHFSVCSTTLWLGRLSKLTAEEEISEHLTDFGSFTINIVPPRGCAYICFESRQQASDALARLKTVYIQGNAVKVAWAAGVGIKNSQYHPTFNTDQGLNYISWSEKGSIKWPSLIEGSALDPESTPSDFDWDLLKKKNKKKKENLPHSNENSNQGLIQMIPLPPQIPLPPPSMATPPLPPPDSTERDSIKPNIELPSTSSFSVPPPAVPSLHPFNPNVPPPQLLSSKKNDVFPPNQPSLQTNTGVVFPQKAAEVILNSFLQAPLKSIQSSLLLPGARPANPPLIPVQPLNNFTQQPVLLLDKPPINTHQPLVPPMRPQANNQSSFFIRAPMDNPCILRPLSVNPSSSDSRFPSLPNSEIIRPSNILFNSLPIPNASLVETSIRPPPLPNLAINPDANINLQHPNPLIQPKEIPIITNASDRSFNVTTQGNSTKQIPPSYFHQPNNLSANMDQTECAKETKKQPLLKTPIMPGESREDGFNPQLVINADHPAYNKVKNVYKSNSYHCGVNYSSDMPNAGRNHEFEDEFCSRNTEMNGDRERSFFRGRGRGRGRETMFNREDGNWGNRMFDRGFNRGFPNRGRHIPGPPFDKERSFHTEGNNFNRDKYRWRRENSNYRIDNREQNSKEINDHAENIDNSMSSKQNLVRNQLTSTNQSKDNPGRSSDNVPLLTTPVTTFLGQTPIGPGVPNISKSPLDKFGAGISNDGVSDTLCDQTSVNESNSYLNHKVNKSQSDVYCSVKTNHHDTFKMESQINNHNNVSDASVVHEDTQGGINKDCHNQINDDDNRRNITNEQNSNLS